MSVQATVAPLKTAPDVTRMESLSDWLSPIVVKEVRQMMRGREFNYSFSLSLVAGLIVSFFGAAETLNGNAAAGAWIFGALMSCLSLIGVAIVPLSAFNALRSERTEMTLDLMTLTALSARRLVIGKLMTQAVKLGMLFAGLAPFMATSFLLGGIDFLTATASIVALFLISIWACAACLLLSSLSKSKAISSLLFVGVAILLVMVFGIGRLLYFASGVGPSGGVLPLPFMGAGVTPWRELAAVGAFCVVTLINMVLLAENRLSLPTEDRTTSLRIGFLVQFVMIVVWAVALPSSSWAYPTGPPPADVLYVLGGLHLAAVAIFTVTEDLIVSRRILRNDLAPGRFRWLLAILRPGGGRGALYMLFQIAILTVAEFAILGDPRTALAISSYIAFFTGVPTFIARRFLADRIKTAHLRAAIFVVLPVASLLPELFYYILTPSREYDARFGRHNLLDPFRTLANWTTVKTQHWDIAVFVIGLVGLVAYFGLIRLGQNARRAAAEKGSPFLGDAAH